MSVEVRYNPSEQRFEIYEDAVRVGLADYSIAGDRLSLLHTEISPEFGGRGLAKQLISFALDHIRDRHLQVLPICPYTLRVITENQDAYLDLVPSTERERFKLPAGN
ncbi:MAG: GNAT family N-acetyltransferase [Actinomycetota bacterium]|nr:GNAT family N-acetyltransferase [Actinomycetota bacterium]